MKLNGKVLDNETLRQMCIDNRWFTGGSNEQYAKLFEFNTYSFTDEFLQVNIIINCIWLCSDCLKDDINRVLNAYFERKE